MRETTHELRIPVSLALLGDLHGRPYGPVINSLRRNQPEIIAIAGDIVYGHQPADDVSPLVSQPNILPFLEHCAAVAPAFLSLGNHEWMLDEADLQQIRDTGVTLLDNSWASSGGIVIGGLTSALVTDYRQYRGNSPEAGARYPERRLAEDGVKDASGGGSREFPKMPDLSWLPAFRAAPGYHILLNHHPEYYPLIPGDIDLILSCHAHGGQWRFYNPVRRNTQGVFAPGQGFFPRWSKGVYDNRLVVSAGLANTTRIPRLFNPTEVVYLRPGVSHN